MIKRLVQKLTVNRETLRKCPGTEEMIENDLKTSVANELKQKIKIERFYDCSKDEVTFVAMILIVEEKEEEEKNEKK